MMFGSAEHFNVIDRIPTKGNFFVYSISFSTHKEAGKKVKSPKSPPPEGTKYGKSTVGSKQNMHREGILSFSAEK